MPRPANQPTTYITVLQGRIILCGRCEVEDDDNVFEKPHGVIVSCAGQRTEGYKYDKKAAGWKKLNIPIGFNGRERSTAWGAGIVAIKAALEAGQDVALGLQIAT